MANFSALIAPTNVTTLTGTQTITNKTLGSGTALGANVAGGDFTLSQAQLKDVGYTFLDKGNSGTSTQTFDFTAGQYQKVTATGNHTWALSNFPPAGVVGYMHIQYYGAGSYTLTPPTIYWQLPTGGHTTNFSTYLSSTGRTALQTADFDEWIVWARDATTFYGKLV